MSDVEERTETSVDLGMRAAARAESRMLIDGDLVAATAGAEFEGEGILAVTKALLQSGVGYVGGYQGAPISHLMDVLADAEDILHELGVHFEASASEATAAAMLAASINYPLRGAVTWKSTVGTNVASDALANLASSGVRGGARVVKDNRRELQRVRRCGHRKEIVPFRESQQHEVLLRHERLYHGHLGDVRRDVRGQLAGRAPGPRELTGHARGVGLEVDVVVVIHQRIHAP